MAQVAAGKGLVPGSGISFLFCFCLFRAASIACGSSQARGRIGAVATAYARGTAMLDPSRICDLHHIWRQSWILIPLSEARDRTCVPMDTSQIRFHWAMTGTPGRGISACCGYSDRKGKKKKKEVLPTLLILTTIKIFIFLKVKKKDKSSNMHTVKKCKYSYTKIKKQQIHQKKKKNPTKNQAVQKLKAYSTIQPSRDYIITLEQASFCISFHTYRYFFIKVRSHFTYCFVTFFSVNLYLPRHYVFISSNTQSRFQSSQVSQKCPLQFVCLNEGSI